MIKVVCTEHTVVPRRFGPTAIRTLRRIVPGFSGTPPRESNGKIDEKDQNEGPSVLPDSAQGPPEGLNPIPHSLGLGVGPLSYLCS